MNNCLMVRDIGGGRREVRFNYLSANKPIAWLPLKLVLLRFACLREVFWRRGPLIELHRDFASDKDEYLASCRFIYGKWFGKKHKQFKPEFQLFGLDKMK